jgi:uncharacterized membrane protein
VRNGRRPSPAWGGTVAVAGLPIMGWAGIRAGRYLPGWGEAEPRCITDGTCTAEEADSALRFLWGVVGGVGLVVLLAAALATWCLPHVRRPPSWRSLRPLLHAAVTGVVGGIAVGTIGMPLLVAVFISWHAVVPALLASWFVHSAVVCGLDRMLGPRESSTRESWLTALGVTFGAAIGAVAFTVADRGSLGGFASVPMVYGASLAVLVLVTRRLRDNQAPAVPSAPGAPEWSGPPAPSPVAADRRPGDAATTVVVVLSLLSGLAVAAGLRALQQAAWPQVPYLSSAPAPAPTPTPAPATPSVPELPPPSAPPAPTPPVIEASVPCSEQSLRFVVAGFDAAMGARAATLQATNVSTGPCWVEGTPVVVLLQGGRPLALTVHPGQTPEGAPAVVQRVDLAPGEAAFALLSWRSYGGWADTETPQSVTAALGASSSLVSVEVTAPSGSAPFDIADGGAWAIAPWAPAWK